MDQPQPIQPVPLPTQWGFDHTPDGRFIVMVANRPSGTDFYFVEADTVDEFVTVLKAQKRHCMRARNGESDTGIVLPAQVIHGPDGQPLHVVPPSDDVIDMAERIAQKRAEAEEDEEPEATVSPFPRPVDEGVPGDDPLLG